MTVFIFPHLTDVQQEMHNLREEFKQLHYFIQSHYVFLDVKKSEFSTKI